MTACWILLAAYYQLPILHHLLPYDITLCCVTFHAGLALLGDNHDHHLPLLGQRCSFLLELMELVRCDHEDVRTSLPHQVQSCDGNGETFSLRDEVNED